MFGKKRTLNFLQSIVGRELVNKNRSRKSLVIDPKIANDFKGFEINLDDIFED